LNAKTAEGALEVSKSPSQFTISMAEIISYQLK